MTTTPTSFTFNGKTAVLASTVVTTISNAEFSDGSILSGTWTAYYDSAGDLLDQTNGSFTVTGVSGTTTFSGMGTLPYANTTGSTSYELHSTASSGGGYSALYVDWKTQSPSSLYEGTPSLYTSVLSSGSSSPTTPLRLISDGTTGSGSVPVITGLPTAESGANVTPVSPFSGVTITDPDSTTTVSATIHLSHAGVISDADGTLGGTGLTEGSAGTYTLSATSAAALTSELDALTFTPVQGTAGTSTATIIDLAINDSDGSASADTTLTVAATCFLRGTMIATPSGEAPVETLRAGDLVTTIEDGVRTARPITWTGGREMDVARFGGRPEAYPVRIRSGAFADGIPCRDLLVTPEHCILTEAGLVPVRMLVNGRSIVIDRDVPRYAFFHVELERHGILLAEALATESYLDTGNRGLFGAADAAPATAPARSMAAPLAVSRALVQPVWEGLAARARLLGFDDAPVAFPELCTQPHLRLLLEDGRELGPCWHDASRHMFHIPRSSRPVGLLSRAAVPAQTIGPFVDDRRLLGVAVDRLVLWTGLDGTVMPSSTLAAGGSGSLALDGSGSLVLDGSGSLVLDGWHAQEGSHRWTNGRAALDLPVAGDETFLDIHLAAVGPYPALQASDIQACTS